MSGEFYIDDVIMYANDDPTKTNMITTGGFEMPQTGMAPDIYEFASPASNALNVFSANGWADGAICAGYTLSEAYEGNRSLAVKNAEGNIIKLGVADKYVFEKNTEYEYEFFFKADSIEGSLSFGIGDTIGENKVVVNGKYAIADGAAAGSLESADNGWYKLSGTMTSGASLANIPLFTINGACDLKVDNVKICKKGTLSSSFFNGGFEEIEIAEKASVNGLADLTYQCQGTPDWSVKDYKKGIVYAAHTADEAYGGFRSLHIKNDGNAAFKFGGVMNTLKLSANTAYNLSFKLKPVFMKDSAIMVGTGWSWGANRTRISADGSVSDKIENATINKNVEGDKAGWIEYTIPGLTTPTALDENIMLFFINEACDIYIDDIVLTDAIGNEVFSADFEKSEFERVPYEPANVMVTKGKPLELIVSWRNPAEPAISKVELYDVTGEKQLISDRLSTVSDANVSQRISVQNTENKVYKAVFTFSNGETREVSVGGSAAATANQNDYTVNLGSWRLTGAHWDSVGAAPVSAELDNVIYRNSPPSIKIMSNIASNDKEGFTELQLKTTETLQKDSKYRISFYVKGSNVYTAWVRGGESGNNMTEILVPWASGAQTFEDWKLITIDHTMKSDSDYGLYFSFVRGIESLWIDDASIYLLDENNAITGDNLLGVAGACEGSGVPADVSAQNIMITNYSEGSCIAWDVATDAEYIAVYESDEGNLNLRAYIPAERGYVDIENLKNNERYCYVVKTVSTANRESLNGTEVALMPVPDAVVISPYRITQVGNEVTVAVDVKNNAMGAGYTAELILGVYDGTILENVACEGEKIIAESDSYAEAVTLQATVSVPEGMSVKAFLWNSLNGMVPIKNAETLALN